MGEKKHLATTLGVRYLGTRDTMRLGWLVSWE